MLKAADTREEIVPCEVEEELEKKLDDYERELRVQLYMQLSEEVGEQMMVKRTTKVAGVKVVRGKKMKTGKGWRLVSFSGKALKATLAKRFKIGRESVAVFRVLPNPDAD